jgi:putative hemolysin
VSSPLGLVLALVPFLLLRVAAAMVEMMLASGAMPRRQWVRDTLLASAASATAQVTTGASVGVVVTLVWMYAGRGAVPLVLALVVPIGLVLLDLVPRGLATDVSVESREGLEIAVVAAGVVLAPILLVERGLAVLLRMRRLAAPLAAQRRLGSWLAVRPGRDALEVSEAGLVARIARFAAKATRDAMVPQVDLCAVPDTASVAQAVALVRERGFSRLPVFRERMFNMIGIVSILDLLGLVDLEQPVTAVMREAFFVPASKPLPELLGTLQAEGRNLALVVDEYGGAVGLVTVEDLVEEIVGEIEDEYDAPRELYRQVAPGIFLVSARAPVLEVNERFGWNVPQGEYETLAGLVLERLGRVPKPGDGVVVGRVRLEVTRASPRAVQELRVRELRTSRR